jgi:DNA repair protein RAD16
VETATRRSALPKLNNKAASISRTSIPNSDASSSEFPDIPMIGEYTSAQKKKAAKSRESLSSVATSNDYNEDSGYSTPATSAAVTPAEQPNSTTTRRGRRPARMPAAESSTPAVNAIARAAALRNSNFSLNSTSKKRKAVILDSDDDDSDNTPDAQLARALQEQEDAAANVMSGMDTDDIALRRTPRKVKKILPKVDFASDSDHESDEDDLKMTNFSPRLAKRPKIRRLRKPKLSRTLMSLMTSSRLMIPLKRMTTQMLLFR